MIIELCLSITFTVTKEKPNKGLTRTLSIGCPRLADSYFFYSIIIKKETIDYFILIATPPLGANLCFSFVVLVTVIVFIV